MSWRSMGEMPATPIHTHESRKSGVPDLPVSTIQLIKLGGRREAESERSGDKGWCGHLRCCIWCEELSTPVQIFWEWGDPVTGALYYITHVCHASSVRLCTSYS